MVEADSFLGPYEAFLFDMDGTLLTSRPAIERVWNAWAAPWGLNASEVIDYLHGRRASDAVEHFLSHLDSHKQAEEIEWVEGREMRDTVGVVEIPGAGDFLNALPSMRWAIVTSAARRLASCRIKPTLIDLHPCAHWRNPMEEMRDGCLTRLFQARQHCATIIAGCEDCV